MGIQCKSLHVLFEIKQRIFGIQVAFFKEIRHYFSIFFGSMREFLVALNTSFTSTIEKGLVSARLLTIRISQ